MSENLLLYTTNLYLQDMAKNIIVSQSKQILEMKNILQQCAKVTNRPKLLEEYQRNYCDITTKMIYEMKHVNSVNNINCNFMNEMIPHHKGAINMAENALRYPVCDELKYILQDIITSQTKEVIELKNYQQIICR